MKNYVPVNCAFHDHLEHFATLRQNVKITYWENETLLTIHGIITDLTGGRDGEFIHFKTEGKEKVIRMDYIQSVDNVSQADFGTDCFI